MADKVRDGWVYGEVKDGVKKTHPCLVPYNQLSVEQRSKDSLMISSVRAVVAAMVSHGLSDITLATK